MFDKFFRGSTVAPDGRRGVGLGLAICRAIVEAHGGQITAANRPEGGAEFIIVLAVPRNAAAESRMSRTSRPADRITHVALTSPRVLLVEDELADPEVLGAVACQRSYQLDEAATGEQALQHAAQAPPDLVILDLGLPDMDGQDVIRQLREWLTAPIIVLSARDQEQQKITALDNGADDYLTKPFSTANCWPASVSRCVMRPEAATRPARRHLKCGDLKVDLAARRVFVGDAEVHLTPIEYKLLTTLVRNAGKVLTHRQLLKEVWGPQQVEETHYLRVFMANLRRKLEADPAQPRYLLTEQGIGYRLASE